MKLDQSKIKELLEGVEISDGAIKGLVALVESHILAEKGITIKRLKKFYEGKIGKLHEAAQKYGDYVKEEMTGKITEYTNYAVKEFIKENKQKLNQLEDYERMKSMFESVKSAFEFNGYKLDENAGTKKARQELNEAKTAFNELFEQFTKANDELAVAKQAIIFESISKDLTLTQKNKLRQLAESVSFDSLPEFKQGLSMLVENVKRDVKKPAATPAETLLESGGKSEKVVDGAMASYLAALKR